MTLGGCRRHGGSDLSLSPVLIRPLNLCTLQLTKERFLVEWEASIVPDIKAGKRVMIAAHGNTLRALCQHLDDIPDDQITGLDIPTGKSSTWVRNRHPR